MWTLFVVSTVIGLEEPRYTRYKEYEHWYQCQEDWQKLSSEFTEGEVAFCEEDTNEERPQSASNYEEDNARGLVN